jgi:hypothetical protein
LDARRSPRMPPDGGRVSIEVNLKSRYKFG